MIKDDDLVAATHGRSFWILDDLTPLHQLTDQVLREPAHLFAPRPTYRLPPPMGYGRPPSPGKSYMVAQGAPATYTETPSPTGQTVRTFLDAGKNPPDGVIVTYYLGQKPEGEVTLSFLEAQGQLIKRFSSEAVNNQPSAATAKEPRVPAEEGMNRFVWNLRYPDAHGVPGDATTERSLTGPLAPPGTYQVQLSVGGQTYTASFELRKDPRVAATQADFEAQFDLLLRIRDKLSETHDAINWLRSIRQQVEDWARRVERGSQRTGGRGGEQRGDRDQGEVDGHRGGAHSESGPRAAGSAQLSLALERQAVGAHQRGGQRRWGADAASVRRLS